MSALLAVLLFLLKLVGTVLLCLLLVLCIALLLPVGIAVRYEREALTLWLKFGPCKILLYPRPHKKPEKQKKSPPKQEEGPKPQPAAAETAEKTKEEKPAGGVAGALQEELGTVETKLRSDPLAFIKEVLTLLSAVGNRLLANVYVRHLTVFWTVTAGDAAATATAYAHEMGLCNTLLALAQSKMHVKADSLRLEPDFAGKFTQNRHFSCQITVTMCIMIEIGIRLLWRAWHDPALGLGKTDKTTKASK